MDFKEITDKIINFVGKKGASYWGNALGGEVGEAQNLIKKWDRGDIVRDHIMSPKEFCKKLGHELADIFIYLELVARYFNLDLEKLIIEKVGIVLDRPKNKNGRETTGG